MARSKLNAILCAALALGSVGCGGEGTTDPTVPNRLVFTVQPGSTIAGVRLAPTVQVAIQDASGRTVTSATAPITLALGNNPAAGVLLGATTVSAVAGVAVFADLTIERAASGYTLAASSGSLAAASSAAFTVAPAAKAKLGFTVQPSTAEGTRAIGPAVVVAVQDAFGNTVTTATDVVAMALGAGPGGGTLSGATTVAAIQGIATFSDLRIDRPRTGYTLRTSAGPLTAATSAPFAVTLTFTAVSSGRDHTCGVTVARAAYCWGGNFSGPPVDGTTLTTPALVAGGLAVAAVSAGEYHTCALTVAGAAWCWGYNWEGQLGDGTTTNRSGPVPVAGGVTFATLSAGSAHTCGRTPAGVVHCWGWNYFGELGDGTTIDRPTPVPVAGGVIFASVTAGDNYTCGVTAAGAAHCWGSGGSGRLGNGNEDGGSSPLPVAGGLTFASLEASDWHTCGVTTSAVAYCWGYNLYAAVGDGTTIQRLAPVRVAGGLPLAAVSLGYLHSCGITAAGAAHCWGYSNFGAMGDGTATIMRATPVTVLGGVSFTAVSAGFSHSCGITSAGALYCWGSNFSGQLGDGTKTNRLVPTRVAH